MDLILGAGLSGLLVAKRLHELGQKYVLLERDSGAGGNAGKGFFFLHEPIFGDEPSFPVHIRSCPGSADPRKYALKVYGDSEVSPVSIKAKDEDHIGYFLETNRLLEICKERIEYEAQIDSVSIRNQLVCSKDGRCWPYDRLHSTIPLPTFSKIIGMEPKVVFHSKPIYIEAVPTERMYDTIGIPAPKDEMYCHYCPGECHDWYRATAQYGKTQVERMNESYASYPVYPGKIWYGTNPMGGISEEIVLGNYRLALEKLNICLWGRYGKWQPKHLTHMTHRELQVKLT